MPSFPPRTEAVKKQQQLSQREQELQHAIQHNFPMGKLAKAVEKYRAAQLSLLKAKIHIIQDKEFQKRPHNLRVESIETKIEVFRNKTGEEIINDFKKNIMKFK